MTFEALMTRLRDELSRTGRPVDVQSFVASYYPHDIQAGQLLTKAFGARLLRGRFRTNLVCFEGHVSGIADDTRPVWH